MEHPFRQGEAQAARGKTERGRIEKQKEEEEGTQAATTSYQRPL
jgi:hypothetical protein|tara:strand:- start:83 stop:214 length:132 start_codon:yes stop_codon:yes gene_type:complete